jgi:hypothetical protein
LANLEVRKKKRPVEFVREHFHGKSLPQGIGIKVDVTPSRFVEQAYFVIHLVRNNESSSDPVFSGVFSVGRPTQFIAGWVDGDYFDTATFPDANRLQLSEFSLDVELFKILGGLVPQAGSLMVSYSLFSKESRIHRETKLSLDRGYPPVVTPLGLLLFLAGCGMGFKDWYFAEGGREGPEKLQGYKPISTDVAREKAEQMLHELREFSRRAPGDDLAQQCKSRAEYVMQELQRSLA